jgi:hypothetical protein
MYLHILNFRIYAIHFMKELEEKLRKFLHLMYETMKKRLTTLEQERL